MNSIEVLSNPKEWEKYFLNEWESQNREFFPIWYDMDDELECMKDTYYDFIEKYNNYLSKFVVYRAINLRDYKEFAKEIKANKIGYTGVYWANTIEYAESYLAKDELRISGYKIIFEAIVKKEQVDWIETLLKNS